MTQQCQTTSFQSVNHTYQDLILSVPVSLPPSVRCPLYRMNTLRGEPTGKKFAGIRFIVYNQDVAALLRASLFPLISLPWARLALPGFSLALAS
jgi:hypothetical protein